MNGAVNENQDGTVEWQALEIKPSLRACSVCLPACSDGQWEGKGQLPSLLGEDPCRTFLEPRDGVGPEPVML